MSLVLLFLKAFRLIDLGNLDLALGLILFDLDCLVILRAIWIFRRGI